MEPPRQLGLELLQNLLDFRELFHRSNLGNVTRTEIAHNGAKHCEVAEFGKMQLHLLPAVDLCFIA